MKLSSEEFFEAIKALATRDEMADIAAKIDAVEEIVSGHTESLDLLVTQTKDWNVEMTVMRNRMERYENALKIVAKKLNVNLQSLLN